MKLMQVKINPTPEQVAKSYIESLERLNTRSLIEIKSLLGRTIHKAQGIIDRTKDLEIFIDTALVRKKKG